VLLTSTEKEAWNFYAPDSAPAGGFFQHVEFIEWHATGNGNGSRTRSQISIYSQELNSSLGAW